jgi:MoxR-like ATPase
VKTPFTKNRQAVFGAIAIFHRQRSRRSTRCIFHVIELDRELVRRAWAARRDDPELQDLAEPVVEKAVSAFMALADNDKLRKPPSIAEFLGWLRLLALDPAAQDRLTAPLAGLPFLSALIKIDEDLAALAG